MRLPSVAKGFVTGVSPMEADAEGEDVTRSPTLRARFRVVGPDWDGFVPGLSPSSHTFFILHPRQRGSTLSVDLRREETNRGKPVDSTPQLKLTPNEPYRKPEIRDYGNLADLTAGLGHGHGLDATFAQHDAGHGHGAPPPPAFSH
jgi:hypothetical protein